MELIQQCLHAIVGSTTWPLDESAAGLTVAIAPHYL